MSGKSIAEFLADEAEAAEAHKDDEVSLVRSRRVAREPSQVYSLRIPVDKLEELRTHAEWQHLNPSALIRLWVLERLEQETSRTDLPQLVRRAVHDELVDAGLITQQRAA
ncbi:MAG: hypothetical protein ACRDPW_03875 [Mycobacteriales bacterium]